MGVRLHLRLLRLLLPEGRAEEMHELLEVGAADRDRAGDPTRATTRRRAARAAAARGGSRARARARRARRRAQHGRERARDDRPDRSARRRGHEPACARDPGAEGRARRARAGASRLRARRSPPRRGTTPGDGRPPQIRMRAPKNCTTPAVVAIALQTVSDQSGSTGRAHAAAGAAATVRAARTRRTSPPSPRAHAMRTRSACCRPYATSANTHTKVSTAGEPEPPAAGERCEAVPHAAHAGGDRDREHGEVGEIGVQRRAPEAHAEARLVPHVQEEDRDRGSEHERAGRHGQRETPLLPASAEGELMVKDRQLYCRRLMSRLLVRRSVTAVGIYSSVALGLAANHRREPRLSVEAGVRRLHDGHLRDELLPVVLRPDGRGSARQVRVPLHHA